MDCNSRGEVAGNGGSVERSAKDDRNFERQAGKWYEISQGRCREVGNLKVGEGHFFVVGDNRPNALDSRYSGALSLLIGSKVKRELIEIRIAIAECKVSEISIGIGYCDRWL